MRVLQSIHCILDYIRTAMLKDRVGFARHLAGMLNRVGSATSQAPSSPSNSHRAIQPSPVAQSLPATIFNNEELEVGNSQRMCPAGTWHLQECMLRCPALSENLCNCKPQS